MDIASTIKDVVFFVLYVSITIGQLIVSVVNSSIWAVFSSIIKILTVIEVISIDFGIFLKDVGERAHFLSTELIDLVFSIMFKLSQGLEAVENSGRKIRSNVNELYVGIYNLINGSIQAILNMFVFFKSCLTLFGRSVWLVITFIPLTLMNLIENIITLIQILPELITNYLRRKFQIISELLGDFYEFVTDVPVESVMGLLIVVCLIYFLTQFYVTLSAYFHERIRSLYTIANNKYRTWKTALIMWYRHRSLPPQPRQTAQERQRRSRQTIIRRPTTTPRYITKFESDNTLCVICQESSKCILLLPCRHLCLCTECSATMTLYNSTCPICRVDIERTMKVFT